MAVCVNCGAQLPEAARFCQSCAAPGERGPEPGEERKVATVLFADLVGRRRSAAWAKRERFRTLETFNDEENAPIRALNDKHGYRPARGSVALRRTAGHGHSLTP